jgi:hypothetical protein
MARGVKTGGRSKGTRNRRTVDTIAKIEASGITPLDYMLSILRNENNAYEVRFQAAQAAAPYCHHRLAAVEHSGELSVTTHEAALNELESEGAGDTSETS